MSTIGSSTPEHIPVNVAPARLVFGWMLVGVPLLYGVVTTLSRVGQLFQ